MMKEQCKDPDFAFLAVDKRKVLEEAPPYDGKKNVWIPDAKEGYARAEIISTSGDDVKLKNELSGQVG